MSLLGVWHRTTSDRVPAGNAGPEDSIDKEQVADLEQVLHDPVECKVFKKFVEAEHSVENLLFWIEVCDELSSLFWIICFPNPRQKKCGIFQKVVHI